MFKLVEGDKGEPILKWFDEYPPYGQRGQWVEIGRKDEKGIERIVEINRKNGLYVFLDEKGIYRAFVLSE